MKKLLALLLLSLPGFAATAPEKEVLAAVEAWKQAALKGDAATLTALFHDDLAYTHSNGATQTKAQSVAAESSPTGIYKGVEMRDVVVRVYGNTALLEYKLDLTHFAGDTAHLHELMVWLKTPQAGWQMLSRHATRLPVAAAPKP
jgi:ketosteroid isomerase-like protein